MNLETSESFMESFVKDIDKQNKIIESIIEKEKINQFEMKKFLEKIL